MDTSENDLLERCEIIVMLIMGILFLFILMVHVHLTKSYSYSSYIDYAAIKESDNCRIAHLIGTCREIRKCPSFFYLLVRSKSRPSHRVLSLLRESHCGFEGKEPIVCCPKIYPTRPSKFEGVAAERFELGRVFPEAILPSSCGVIAVRDKIFGGKEADLNDFPWMALLGYETPQGLDYRCGGTLINRRYILTAAHCVTNLKSVILKSVRLGEYDQFSEIDCSDNECAPPSKDFPIKRYISHPGFREKELRNDIALIELAQDVNFTKSVQPVCLPIETPQRQRILDGEMGVISGWGATEHGSYSSVLRTTKIRILPQTECSLAYDGIIQIFPSQLCAGGQGWKDSCRGDSGGPLTIIGQTGRHDLAFIQYGIVSFGPRICGIKGRPGVYTRVPYYMDWIIDVMKRVA